MDAGERRGRQRPCYFSQFRNGSGRSDRCRLCRARRRVPWCSLRTEGGYLFRTPAGWQYQPGEELREDADGPWFRVTRASSFPPSADATAYVEITGPGGEVVAPSDPDGPQPWVPPTSAADAYAVGAEVTHPNAQDGGALWLFRSAIAANTTEPGTDGSFHRWWTPIEPITP